MNILSYDNLCYNNLCCHMVCIIFTILKFSLMQALTSLNRNCVQIYTAAILWKRQIRAILHKNGKLMVRKTLLPNLGWYCVYAHIFAWKEFFLRKAISNTEFSLNFQYHILSVTYAPSTAVGIKFRTV